VDTVGLFFNSIDARNAPCWNVFSVWGSAMKQWMKDRDLLIEETLAFAQRVTAVKPVPIETLPQLEPPKAVELAQVAKPREKLFEREEIRQRVADFKTNQHKFEREREEYFKKTMAKVRSNSSGSDA